MSNETNNSFSTNNNISLSSSNNTSNTHQTPYEDILVQYIVIRSDLVKVTNIQQDK